VSTIEEIITTLKTFDFPTLLDFKEAFDTHLKEVRKSYRVVPKNEKKEYIPLRNLKPGGLVWLNVRGRGFTKGMYKVDSVEKNEIVVSLRSDPDHVKALSIGGYLVTWFPLAEKPYNPLE
jgi:hypothetical protein